MIVGRRRDFREGLTYASSGTEVLERVGLLGGGGEVVKFRETYPLALPFNHTTLDACGNAQPQKEFLGREEVAIWGTLERESHVGKKKKLLHIFLSFGNDGKALEDRKRN